MKNKKRISDTKRMKPCLTNWLWLDVGIMLGVMLGLMVGLSLADNSNIEDTAINKQIETSNEELETFINSDGVMVYDESAGDGDFYYDFEVDEKKIKICFEWDTYNPPEGREYF